MNKNTVITLQTLVIAGMLFYLISRDPEQGQVQHTSSVERQDTTVTSLQAEIERLKKQLNASTSHSNSKPVMTDDKKEVNRLRRLLSDAQQKLKTLESTVPADEVKKADDINHINFFTREFRGPSYLAESIGRLIQQREQFKSYQEFAEKHLTEAGLNGKPLEMLNDEEWLQLLTKNGLYAETFAKLKEAHVGNDVVFEKISHWEDAKTIGEHFMVNKSYLKSQLLRSQQQPQAPDEVMSQAAHVPLIWEKTSQLSSNGRNQPVRNVTFADGHSEMLTDEEFYTRLLQAKIHDIR